MKYQAMTEGAPWKHILRFVMPVLAGSLLQQLYNTADTIIVGKFAGEMAMAAVGTTYSMTFVFLAIAIGFSAGNGVVVAQHFGAGDTQQVRDNASTGILLLLMMGAAAAIVGYLITGPVFTSFVNVPQEILPMTLQYFRIYAIGLIFQFGYNIYASILRAVGDSAATLYFLLIASVLNIGLDFVFVGGLHMSAAGAAAATDISQAACFIAAYFYMTKKYPVFRFRLRDYAWRPAMVKSTVKIGFPIALQLVIVSMGLTLIQRAVNGFGRIMTASFTVGQRIELYLNLPCNAFQTTMATYTGQNIGAGRMDRVRLGVRHAMIICLIVTLIISCAVWIFSGNIIHLFSLSDEAAEYCLQHLQTIAFINIILTMYVPLFGVFQGANHSSFPTIIVSSALGIRILVTYLFRYSPVFGHTIIWWNGLFGFGAGFIITWSYYFSRRWQKNARLDGVKGSPPVPPSENSV